MDTAQLLIYVTRILYMTGPTVLTFLDYLRYLIL